MSQAHFFQKPREEAHPSSPDAAFSVSVRLADVMQTFYKQISDAHTVLRDSSAPSFGPQ